MVSLIDMLDFKYPVKSGRGGGSTASKKDVSVGIYGKYRDQQSVCIAFRNELSQLITGNGERMVCAIFRDCIYFKADAKGYKASSAGHQASGTKRIQFTPDTQTMEKYKAFEGDYELKYDGDEKIYYIQKEGEKK